MKKRGSNPISNNNIVNIKDTNFLPDEPIAAPIPQMNIGMMTNKNLKTVCFSDYGNNSNNDIIGGYGDQVYFKPYGNMGDNASSLNGVMGGVGNYYSIKRNDDLSKYNRIFCNECDNNYMINADDTDDIRRNYVKLIDDIRVSRNTEDPMYFLNSK